MPSPWPHNLRRSPRVPVRGIVSGQLRDLKTGERTPCRLFDISREGLGVWSHVRMNIGSTYTFEPDWEKPPKMQDGVPLQVKVRWSIENFANTALVRTGLEALNHRVDFAGMIPKDAIDAIPDEASWMIVEKDRLHRIVEENRRLRSQLDHMQSELHHTETTPTLAHDLAGPLNVLQLLAQEHHAELGKLTSQAQLRGRAAKISQAATLAASILKSTQREYRTKKVPGQPGPADLRQALDSVSFLVKPDITREGIRFESFIPRLPTDILVGARLADVLRIVMNLVQNAIEAVAQTNNPWVHLDVQLSEDQVKVIITDSGHGIEADVVDRMFQKNYTTKEGDSSRSGHGLGLFIARELCENNNGVLTFDNKARNTRFILRLNRVRR